MTVAERIAELAGEIRTVLVHYGAAHEDDLILDLAELMSGIIAREVELRCRTPQSQKGPGRGDGWPAEKRRRDRRPA